MQNSYCLLGLVSPSFLNLSLISYFPFLHDLHPSPAALHHYGPLWKSSSAIKPPPQAPDSSSVYSLCTSKENHCNRWLYWVWSFIVAIDGFKAQNIWHIFWQLPWDCIGCFCLTNPDKVVNVFPAKNLHQWGCKSGFFARPSSGSCDYAKVERTYVASPLLRNCQSSAKSSLIHNYFM